MSSSQHPDDEELLRKLVQGKLPLAEVERLALVYADDQRLAALAETSMGQEDTLIDALRGCRAKLDPAAEQLVDRLVERLRQTRTDFELEGTIPVDTRDAEGNRSGDESEPPQPQRLEHFRVMKVLGRGGMGTVYLAEDTRLQRQVAIKTLRPELAASPSAKERFLREARLAAAIEHDHIVPIFHVGQQDGVPFLAMPLLKGESLDATLQRAKRLDIPQAVRIARQTALALAAAHDRGLIHRDIKPGNIWIEPTEGGRVRVLDFGLARAEADDAQLTVSGVILGTPAYMAPEQAGGKHVDARADLFSLGVVLYQMLTGRRPFVGDTALAVLVNVTTQNPTPLQTLRPDCPADLSLLVMRLLAKEPAERPATAREVAQTLAGWESSAAHVRDEPSQLQPSLAPRVESGEPASVPLPQACPQPRRIRPWIAATLLLALIGGGLLFGGTVVRLVTNRGILAVEVEDPNVEIRIVQNGLVVQDPTSQREFTLSAGKGEIEVLEKDGIKLATRQFELTRGGTTRVKVTWEEPAQVRQTPKEPAASPGSDPDRRAAEWVLSIGGTVQVGQDGLAQGIANAAGLPPGEFALTHIGLSHNDRVTDAGLAACEGCRNVISLDLSYTGVTAAGLAHFRDCRDLEYLGLHHATQVTDEAMGYFAHCSRLQHLVVPGTQVTDAGLANFKECRDLVQLDLGGTRVTDARLADFQDCEDLEILWLTDCPGITDAGLAPLAKCPKLKLLALNNNPGITDAGLAHFAGSADLANLNLSYTRVTDAGLAHFKDRENLTDLFLSGTQITDVGLAHFQRCKKLWNLQLADTRVTDDGLGCLRGCTQLSNLTLTDTQVGDRGLAAFAGSKDLYALDLHNTRATEAGLAAFADCKHVRLLGLGFTPMTDAILPWLASLEDPGAISLINTRISLAGYEQLKAALPRCEITWWDANRVVAEEVLKLGGRVEIGLRDQESPRAIQAVGELPREAFHVRYVALAGAAQPPFHSLAWLQYPGLDRLEQLDLAECPVHDLGFLGPIQGLSDLSLAGTGMNDETLARLPPIPTLKRLVLDGNEIRGPGLAALAERPALAELSLGCPTLTDLGAAPLAKLTQLRRLSLAGSGLGDDGLKHLAGLTNLESLDLRKTQVTAAGVDTLQKALPKCQITFPKS